MKLCHMTGHTSSIIAYIQHLGGTASLKFGKAKKRLKFGAIYDNFWLWPRIFQKSVVISTKGHKLHREQSQLRWKKIDELRFTNKKVIDADVDLPKFKIRRVFGQLQNLIANISEADRHTENR